MRSAGYNAGNCFHWNDPVTCPGGACNYKHGWYFLVY